MTSASVIVSGRVQSAAYRSGVAGVRVVLQGHRDGADIGRNLTSVLTDVDGGFVLRFFDDGSMARFAIVVTDSAGVPQSLEGEPVEWAPGAKPGFLSVSLSTDGIADDCGCPCADLSGFPQGQFVAGEALSPFLLGLPIASGGLAHVVGVVRGPDGSVVANARLRLTARIAKNALASLPAGTATGATLASLEATYGTTASFGRDVLELARTYTDAQGRYHLVYPKIVFPFGVANYRGQGWPQVPYAPWSGALRSPALLTLALDVPLNGGAVDVSVAPAFDVSYKTLETRAFPVRKLEDVCDQRIDWVAPETGRAADTEFGHLDALLSAELAASYDAATFTPIDGFNVVDIAGFAFTHDLPADWVAAYFLSYRLNLEMRELANRGRGALQGSASSTIALTQERMYGLLRHGLPPSSMSLREEPLARIREGLQWAGGSGVIRALGTLDLDAVDSAMLDAGIGVNLLPLSVANPPVAFRANTLGANLHAGGTTAAQRLAVVRYLWLLEQYRRADFLNKPANTAALWEATGAVWQKVQAGQTWTSTFPAGTVPAAGADYTRMADNAVLDDLLFGVTEVVLNVRAVPATSSGVGALTQAVIEASTVDVLPIDFLRATDAETHAAYYEAVMRRARKRHWNQALSNRLSAFGLDPILTPTLSALPAGTSLRTWRPKSESDLTGGTAPQRLAALRAARVSQAQEKILPPGRVDAAAYGALAGKTPLRIATRGLARFKAEASGLGAEAEEVFHRSTFQSLAAMNYFALTHINAGGAGLKPPASPGSPMREEALNADFVPHAATAQPSGLQGYITYEPWRTTFSPLAYLDDLRRWVKNRSETALDELDARRPDIGFIRLSQPNTFQAVAYLDLALEVMEYAAANHFSAGSVVLTALDTSPAAGGEGSLGTYLIGRAYVDPGTSPASLQTHLWPWSLPFDLPTWRVHAWLGLLGTTRAEGIRALNLTPDASAEAAAELELGPYAAQVFVSGTDPSAAIGGGSAPTSTSVPSFMAHFGLGLEDVRDLVAMTVLHPVGGTSRAITLGATFDDLDFATTWDSEDLHRAARVLRLRAATGWSFYEMDLVLRGTATAPMTGESTIRTSALQRVGAVRRLFAMTGIPVEELAGFYAPLDPLGDGRSQEGTYRRVFLSRLAARENRAEDPFGPGEHPLDISGVEVVGTGLAYTAAPVALAASAALGVTAAEYAQLTALVTGNVTLAGLSHLWRHVRLARHVGWNIEDFLRILSLWDAELFDGPNATIAFLEAADALRVAGVRPRALLAVLDGDDHGRTDTEVPNLAIAALAEELLADTATLRRSLDNSKEVVNPTDWSTELSLLLGAYLEPTDVNAIVASVAAATDPVDLGALSVALHPVAAATVPLDGASPLPARVVAEARSAILRFEARAMASQRLAAWMPEIPGAVAGRLVDLEASFLSDLTSETPVAANLQARLRTIWRAGQLARWSSWDVQSYDWYRGPGAPNTSLAPHVLPVNAASAAGSLPKLLQNLKFTELERGLPLPGPALTQIWGELASSSATLAARLGWAVADVDALTTLLGSVPSPMTFAYFRQVLAAASYLTRTRISVHTSEISGLFRPTYPGAGAASDALLSWNHADVAEAAARRSFSTESAWSAAAGPVRNREREHRRHALVSYLCHRGTTPVTADNLYEDLLIDVSMTSCGQTSRVQQAIAATQQFIQRAILGYEPTLSVTEEDVRDWRWMKTYRVWEAARNVFLYPENWLRPELRSDKTPLFEAFESAIGSEDLKEASVEKAVIQYLEGLHEISRLRVLAIYNASKDDGGGPGAPETHVVARTESSPASYFYRYRKAGRWSPWEKMEVGLDGDHVLLVVFQGRLQVLWISFEDSGKTSTVRVDKKDENKGYHREHATGIRVHAAIRDQQGWTKPKVSEKMRVAFWVDLVDDRSKIVFRTQQAVYDGKPVLLLWYLGCGQSEGNRTKASREDYRPRRLVKWDPSRQVWQALAGGSPTDLYVPLAAKMRFFADASANRRFRETRAVSLPLLDGQVQRTAGRQLLVNPQTFVLPSDGLKVDFDQPWVLEADAGVYLVTAGPEGASPSGARAGGNRTSSSHSESQPSKLAAATAALPQGVLGADAADDLVVNSGLPNRTFSVQGDPDRTAVHISTPAFRAELFFHPYVGDVLSSVYRHGLRPTLRGAPGFEETALLFRQAKQEGEDTEAEQTIRPLSDAFPEGFPGNHFEFGADGAYSLYNWELFFHLPMLVADRYREVGRFEESLRWLEFVYDPSEDDGGPDSRVWRFGPFAPTMTAARDQEIEDLASGSEDLAAALAYWVEDPFDAHRAARVRKNAYRRWTVLTYIRTLMEWGDERFTRYTLETINEARQLYVLAGSLLGPRPVAVDAPPAASDLTVASLADDTDAADAAQAWVNTTPKRLVITEGIPSAIPGSSSFFAVPANERLLALWDWLEDRMFKIRNCLNIEGQFVPLPLFEPPIDPGRLVDGRGSGADVAGTVSSLRQVPPPQRFQPTYQRAAALAGSLRALSGALLSALEKRDAEDMALLRSNQEIEMLNRVIDIRRDQVQEARVSLAQLEGTKAMVEARQAYYTQLIDGGLNSWENAQRALWGTGMRLTRDQIVVGAVSLTARTLVPDLSAGVNGIIPTLSAAVKAGQIIATPAEIATFTLQSMANVNSQLAQLASMEAGFARRKEEWTQQQSQATLELKTLDHQISAANLRIAIAEKELANQNLQVQHAKTNLEFMKTKFTNRQLYHWMSNELKALCFRSYQLALDLALRAQTCFAYETGLSTQFVTTTHWDPSRAGLLAGERLQVELERMEADYAVKDQREYELNRSFSLAVVDGVALERLREDGYCFFYLPEALFDLDAPGHYFRRIRRIAVSIPCTTGSFSHVHAKLTLVSSGVRTEPTTGPVVSSVISESIVTSTGQDDTGTFGQQDGRYQPFEYRGAVNSVWRLELLDRDRPHFDHHSITDVVLSMSYTARDGGATFTAAVKADWVEDANDTTPGFSKVLAADATPTPPTGTANPLLVFSARRQQPDAFYRFTNPLPSASSQVLDIDLSEVGLPREHAGSTFASVEIVLVTSSPPAISPPDPPPDPVPTAAVTRNGAALGTLTFYEMPGDLAPFQTMAIGSLSGLAAPFTGTLSMSLDSTDIALFAADLREDPGGGQQFKPGAVVDVLFLFRYAAV